MINQLIKYSGLTLLFIAGVIFPQKNMDPISNNISGYQDSNFHSGEMKKQKYIKSLDHYSEWYENAILPEGGSYSNGNKDGLWLEKDGLKPGSLEIGNYNNGQKHGLWKSWDKYGNIINHGNYNNGTMDGIWVVRENNFLLSKLYKSGKLIKKSKPKPEQNSIINQTVPQNQTAIDEVWYTVESPSDNGSPDSDQWTALQINTYAGNIETVKRLINEGANVNAGTRNEGKTPLMMASALGHVDIIDILVNSGADLNLQDNKGFTSIMSSATNGRLDMTKLLVDKGADVFIRGNDERMYNEILILAFAIEFKEYDLVNSLLEIGVNVNGRITMGSYENWTPLMIAIQLGDFRASELLLNFGADALLFDSQGKSSLYYGIKYEQFDILKFILATGVYSKIDDDEYAALTEFAKKLKFDEIVALLASFKNTDEN